ncbi:MAG TPA: TIM44-like domain-containing protein, partial [Cytophaga sp.]|nr:TIM44-like domain-containing protein [Cytophaga sp.]
MKFKAALKFLLLFTFTLLLAFAEANEGVNDSSGSHASTEHTINGNANNDSVDGNVMYTTFLIVTLVAIAAIFGTMPILTKLKSYFAAKIMTHASNKDTFWNTAELKKHAERTFYEIQDCWENKNMSKVKNAVDEKFYLHYTTLLATMIQGHEKNIRTQIHIDEIRIIGCEDYIDDSKDRYIAYIQGRLLDYVINEHTQEIIKNSSKI